MKTTYRVLLLVLTVLLFWGCAGDTATDQKSPKAEAPAVTETKVEKVLTKEQQFFKDLSAYCGKAYRGKLTYSPQPEFFQGKPFIAFFEYCNDKEISIAYSQGEDKSQTWKLTNTANGLRLKHDIRKDNGDPKKITMFGGDSNNAKGSASSQTFPADKATAKMIPKAAKNEWFLDLDQNKNTFSYSFARSGKKRFGVAFDLSKPQKAK